MTNRLIFTAILLATLLAAWACGGGGGTPSLLPGGAEHTQEINVDPDTGGTLTLESGARIFFPAGTFDVSTIVVFSDTIVGPEREGETYPAGATGLISYLTINNPASQDNQFHQDVSVTFNLRVSGIPEGRRYWVYRYDDLEGKWVRFGNAVATVGKDGLTATASLPTTGISYYVGSVGLFDGLLADGGDLPTGVAGLIGGVVTDSVTGDPVEHMDLMLYLVVGESVSAHDFLNGVADPDNPNNHNLIYTDENGRYELQFGESDIGAGMVYLVRLAQLHEDYTEAETSSFTVSAGTNPDKNLVVVPAQSAS